MVVKLYYILADNMHIKSSFIFHNLVFHPNVQFCLDWMAQRYYLAYGPLISQTWGTVWMLMMITSSKHNAGRTFFNILNLVYLIDISQMTNLPTGNFLLLITSIHPMFSHSRLLQITKHALHCSCLVCTFPISTLGKLMINFQNQIKHHCLSLDLRSKERLKTRASRQ